MRKSKKIGRLIEGIRKRKHYSQEELARVLCVSEKTVRRWEDGTYFPCYRMTRLIETQFGVNLFERG